jgi:hypothetical protein
MLLEGDQLPAFASADYRLGAFHATTMGAEVGHAFAGGWSLRFGVEYYLQHGDTSPPVFGSLARHDLYPGMNAWMVRVGAKVPL